MNEEIQANLLMPSEISAISQTKHQCAIDMVKLLARIAAKRDYEQIMAENESVTKE